MSRRVTITLHEDDFALLLKLSQQFGHPPATVAGDMLVQSMFDYQDACDGMSDRMAQIQYLLQTPAAGTA